MYRKLKNILGVSLMVLAIVISQLPMPEAQAEIGNTAAPNTEVDDISAHTVTFSMNGGNFDGNYNGYRFKEQTPVLVIDDGDVISSFPEEKYASFSGCRTEQDVWYTDNECLNEYNKDNRVTESITLYKKWYRITSDGTTLADKGFHLNPDGSILYKYDGEQMHVEIPETVKTIVKDAFSNLDSVRGITLPAGIKEIDENAFSGLKDGEIIYIYDSDTAASKGFGKQLDNQYEQLVYSEYLDLETVEEIAGISFNNETSKENAEIIEKPETDEGSDAGNESSKNESQENAASDSNTGSEPSESETESESATTQESETKSQENESKPTESETKPEESTTTQESSDTEESTTTQESSDTEESTTTQESSDTEESATTQESESEESSSSGPITVEPDTKYTVTFDTQIEGVEGEKREVISGKTISELVEINGDQPRILRKDTYQINKDDGRQEITYTFKGWYKDKDFSKEWDFSSDTIEGDTTLFAKWDRQTRAYYYVDFVAEGAANVPEKQKLYEDEKLQKPTKKPSIKNKIFKGWYTDKTNTSTEFKAWGKPVTKNMTLYAQFEERSYTVVFHMNGGGFTGKYNDVSYTDAASLKAKVTVGKGIESAAYPGSSSSSSFKYSNYTTDTNWYKDKECLEPYAKKDAKGADTILSGDLTLYKKWYYTSSGFTMNTTGNVLYKYGGNVADVTIPNTVNIIGENAFSSVGSISTITLPDNISEVRPNAFSGVNNISKDITITGKTEHARNVAKGLANEYKHLVYKDSQTTDTTKKNDDKNAAVSTAESGSIKLGATIAGSTGTKTNSQTSTADKSTAANTNTASATGSISLGASSINTTGASFAQPGTTTAPDNSVQQKPAGTQNIASSTSKGSQSQTASSAARITKKQNVTSASAPKSTEHIKDSTPKTGDPLQYRMLLVCAMFSIGSLLVLTGNGRRKKSSAS